MVMDNPKSSLSLTVSSSLNYSTTISPRKERFICQRSTALPSWIPPRLMRRYFATLWKVFDSMGPLALTANPPLRQLSMMEAAQSKSSLETKSSSASSVPTGKLSISPTRIEFGSIDPWRTISTMASDRMHVSAEKPAESH